MSLAHFLAWLFISTLFVSFYASFLSVLLNRLLVFPYQIEKLSCNFWPSQVASHIFIQSMTYIAMELIHVCNFFPFKLSIVHILN